MVDLHSSFLGLALSNPVIACPRPVVGGIDGLHALVDAGAAAIALPSLFEEQMEADLAELERGLGEDHAEAFGGFLPDVGPMNSAVDDYVEMVEGASARLNVPVIASLNGETDGGWLHGAQRIEDAGAAALELNIAHVAADPNETAAAVEDRYLRIVERLRREVNIPLAVKVGPYFSAFANMATRLESAGADGLVLFSHLYHPVIDIERRDIRPHLGEVDRTDPNLTFRWIAVLRDHLRGSLAAADGITDEATAIAAVLSGADVVMVAGDLTGVHAVSLSEIVAGIVRWCTEHDYDHIADARGCLARHNVANPDAYERGTYLQAINRNSRP